MNSKDCLPVYICDAIRTPIGRYGGSLSSVRPDDLGAIPIKALRALMGIAPRSSGRTLDKEPP